MFARQWGGPGDRVSESRLLGPARPYAIIDKNELAPDLTVAEPQVTKEARASLESIIDGDERMDLPAAVARILMAARPVAHLSTNVGTATGFLIAPSLLMTNNHAFLRKGERRVATPADAKDARAMFNYQQDIAGNFAATQQYAVDADSFFLADQELDCAVVALEGEPGAAWGTLKHPTPARRSKADRDGQQRHRLHRRHLRAVLDGHAAGLLRVAGVRLAVAASGYPSRERQAPGQQLAEQTLRQRGHPPARNRTQAGNQEAHVSH
jgi:hypothetical protein